MIDDMELARRSILGFGETIATLGYWGAGPESVIRRPDALGAKIASAAGNPWMDAAVVPPGVEPPADGPLLPHCLWTLADAAPGRVEQAAIAMPCLGVALDDPRLTLEPLDIETPPLEIVGAINERAYGQFGMFARLVRSLRDDRIQAHGLIDQGTFVCVALTLAVREDISIQYVATEASHRRRGLASKLLAGIMAVARREGKQSATLQASPDGFSVYERLGFRRVATLRAFLRPEIGN